MVLIKSGIPDTELNGVWYSWKTGVGYQYNPTLTYKKNKRTPPKNYFKAGVGVVTLNPQAISGVVEGLQGKGYDRLFKSTSQMSNLEIGLGLSTVALYAVAGSVGSRLGSGGKGKGKFPSLKDIKSNPKFKKYFPNNDKNIDAQYLTTKYRYEKQTPRQRQAFENQLVDYEMSRLEANLRYNRDKGSIEEFRKAQEELDIFANNEYSAVKERSRTSTQTPIRQEKVEDIYAKQKSRTSEDLLEGGETSTFTDATEGKRIEEWYEEFGTNQEGIDIDIQELGRRVMSMLDAGDGNISEPPVLGRWTRDNLNPEEARIIESAYNNPKVWNAIKSNYRKGLVAGGAIAGTTTAIQQSTKEQQPTEVEEDISPEDIEEIIDEETNKDESIDLVEEVEVKPPKTDTEIPAFGGRQGEVRPIKDEKEDKEDPTPDYKDLIEQHKNEVIHKQTLGGGKVDTHHLFYHPVIYKNLALEYLRECQLVYTPVEGRAEEVGVEYLEDESNYYGLRVRVAKLGERTIVAFRGTASLKNLEADLTSRGWNEAKLSDYFDFVSIEDDLKVHLGFIQSIKDIYEQLSTILEGRDNIEYVGHSLGSIVCIYCYLKFVETGQQPKTLYTFGSPRLFVNDPNYPVERFNDNIDCIRFFNQYDGISYLPSQTSKAVLGGIGGLVGGFLGYSLGSLFHKRVSDRITKTTTAIGSSAVGSVIGRQAGGYIHIGTGVCLFDTRGATIKPEYSLHTKHSGGRLPNNSNYIVIPKGIDIYRNLLDYNSHLGGALLSAFNTIIGTGISSQYENLSKTTARIIEEIPTQDFIKNIADTVLGESKEGLGTFTDATVGKRTEDLYLTENILDSQVKEIKQVVFSKVLEVARQDYEKNLFNVIEGKEALLENFDKNPDILLTILENRGFDEFTRFKSIDNQILNQLLNNPYIPQQYTNLFNKNSEVRNLWSKIRRQVLKGKFITTSGKASDYISRISYLLGFFYAVLYTTNKFYYDGYEILKYGYYHTLKVYADNLQLLPNYIAEEKNNNHTIQANVFSDEKEYDTIQPTPKSTEEVIYASQKTRTSEVQTATESSEVFQEGSKESQDKQEPSREKDEMREAVINAFGKKEGEIVDISGSEIDDPDFWKELYEETDDLVEKDRTTFRYTPHRHNPHSHYKLNRNREEIKEKIDNLTNPKYNLQHIKNGYYLDTNDKENTYKSIIDGDTISFRKTNIKILGYYFYKEIDEIKNKIIVF